MNITNIGDKGNTEEKKKKANHSLRTLSGERAQDFQRWKESRDTTLKDPAQDKTADGRTAAGTAPPDVGVTAADSAQTGGSGKAGRNPTPGQTGPSRDEQDMQYILGVGPAFSFTGDPEDVGREMQKSLGAWGQKQTEKRPEQKNGGLLADLLDIAVKISPPLRTGKYLVENWNELPSIVKGYSSGLFSGEETAPESYSEAVRAAWEEGAALRGAVQNPLAAIGNYVGGDVISTDPENLQVWGRRGQRDPILNIIRSVAGENLAALAEIKRFTKERSEDPQRGIFSAETYDQLAEDFRQAAEQAEQNLNTDNTLWNTLMDFQVMSLARAADLAVSARLRIPPNIPKLVRTFADALHEAEQRGYSSDDQAKRALYSIGKIVFRNILHGYKIADGDRELAEETIALIAENQSLQFAVGLLPEARYPSVVDTVLDVVYPVAGYITDGVGDMDKKEFLQVVEDYVDETVVRLLGIGPAADGNGGAFDKNPLGSEEETKYNKEWYTGSGKEFVEDPFGENGQLLPDVEYVTGEYDYHYETDDQGRPCRWFTNDLQFTERGFRLPHARNTPGKLPFDQAGHLAGDRFGGSHRLDNLVSQYWLVNLSKYKRLENQWAAAVRMGLPVSVNVGILYEDESNPLRPSAFSVEYHMGEFYKSTVIYNDGR